ncbi:MAG TPA: alpha/beta fold hydrolase, partial [Aggregatilineales bacterium]|nr:alpha/beta fold hydrolase [Aggregatilineales bacterium]
WMLGYGAYGGLGFAEMYAMARYIEDNNPQSWVQAFTRFGRTLEARAGTPDGDGHRRSAGETYLKAACAYRAALQMLSPRRDEFADLCSTFKGRFWEAMPLLEVPIEPVSFPYAGKALPGYFVKAGDSQRPTLIMIGGGDSYCEDLYFFAAAGALHHGYNTLMVDLPGQGDTPMHGLFFELEMEKPVGVVVDYALTRPEIDPARLAIMGISGGGFMVTRAAGYEKRLKAVIADTPIYDMARVLDAEIPAALLHAPAVIGNVITRVAGAANAAGRVNMEKYAWQRGMKEPMQAMAALHQGQADIDRVSMPMLCLAGKGDPAECIAQTRTAYEHNPSPLKAMRVFTVDEGAEAQCQVNNLPLLHQVIFDWLDTTFAALAT